MRDEKAATYGGRTRKARLSLPVPQLKQRAEPLFVTFVFFVRDLIGSHKGHKGHEEKEEAGSPLSRG